MADAHGIDDVNALDQAAFVARFGHVYEDTPELATAAWSRRPFADRDALLLALHCHQHLAIFVEHPLDDIGRRELVDGQRRGIDLLGRK